MEATEAKLIAATFIKNGRNKKRTALALRPHLKETSAEVQGHRMLSNVKVQEYLAQIASNAVQRVEKLADGAKSEHVKLLANQDILDRAGFSPKKESEGNKTLIINITGETAARYGLLGEQK